MSELPPASPLVRASFYTEALKDSITMAPAAMVTTDQVVAQVEVLLRDAGVTSMSGREVVEDLVAFAITQARVLCVSPLLTMGLLLDGLMLGVAFAGELTGPDVRARTRA